MADEAGSQKGVKKAVACVKLLLKRPDTNNKDKKRGEDAKLQKCGRLFTCFALLLAFVGEPILFIRAYVSDPLWLFYLRAFCIAPALWAALLIVWTHTTKDREFLARMTAEASRDEEANDSNMPWDVAHTHLRYNARRMRADAGMSLTIILVAIIIGLLFYAFADTLIRLLEGGKTPSPDQTWASLAARIAIGGLLIFLVQVLAGIYRYSIRMAAFYEGRAAALLIARNEGGVTVGVLKELVDWLAGDKVKFDTGPKTPIEVVAEVAKSVAESTAEALKKD
jgi:hypothetical protein